MNKIMDINIDRFSSRSVNIIDDLYKFTIINHQKIYSFEWDIKADDLYETEKKKIVEEIEMLLGEHEHKGLTIIYNMGKYWERLHKQDKMKKSSRLFPYGSRTPNDSAVNVADNSTASNLPNLPSKFDEEYDSRFGELDNSIIPGFEPSPTPVFTINGFVIPDDFGKNKKKLGRPRNDASKSSAVDNYKFIKKYEESVQFKASVDQDEKEDEEMRKRQEEALRPVGRPRVKPIKIRPIVPPKPFKHPVPYPQFLNRPLDIPREDIPLKIDTGYDVTVANNIIDKNTIDSIYAGDYNNQKVKNPRGRPEGSKNVYNYIPLNGPNGGIQALKSSNFVPRIGLSSIPNTDKSDYSLLAKKTNQRIITKDVPILPTKTVINFTRENSFPDVSHLPPIVSLTAPISSIKNKVGRPMIFKEEKTPGKRGRVLGSRNIGPTARSDREVIIIDKEIAFSEKPSNFELYVIKYSRNNRTVSYAEWNNHVNKKFKECHNELKMMLNECLEGWKELNISMIVDLKEYLTNKILDGTLESADGGVKPSDLENAKLYDPVHVLRANMLSARKERKERRKNVEGGSSDVVKIVVDNKVESDVTVKKSDVIYDLINFDEDPIIPNVTEVNDLDIFKDLNDIDLINFDDNTIVNEPDHKYMFNPELILTTDKHDDLYASDSTDIHDISDNDSDVNIDVVTASIDEKMEVYNRLYDASNLIVEIYKHYREINFVVNLLSVKKSNDIDGVDDVTDDYLDLD